MTNEELNKLSLSTIEELTDAGNFEQIKICDEMIKNNDNPKDVDFYQTQQDQLNYAYGEILIAYYTLKAELKTYIAVSKSVKRLEAIAEGGKVPGDAYLEDLAIKEVDELYKGSIILEGWVERGLNSIKTCRNHTYSDKDERVLTKE